jgi:tRNA/tmRNA/rRNA uracil-C5-methylase (TrmA/RlmC/RlmD family)
MYSAGNGTERMRVRHLELRSDPEVVVDMFAGIGYFTIPFALRSPHVRLVAIEKVRTNKHTTTQVNASSSYLRSFSLWKCDFDQ